MSTTVTLTPQSASSIKIDWVHTNNDLFGDTTLEQGLSVTDIAGVNPVGDTFVVKGNQVVAFAAGTDFVVSGSTGNDGSYTSTLSQLNVNNDTVISVANVPDATLDGIITKDWVTISGVIPQGTNTYTDEDLVIDTEYSYRLKKVDWVCTSPEEKASTLGTLPIILANPVGEAFVVAGNYISNFQSGATFTVSGSTDNDGNYTSLSSEDDGSGGTRVFVTGNVTSATNDGVITLT